MELAENEVKEFNKDELLSETTFDSIYAINNDITRARYIAQLSARAKDLRISTEFKGLLKVYEELYRQRDKIIKQRAAEGNNTLLLDYGKHGKPLSTVDNFLKILQFDNKFKDLSLNEFSYCPEKLVDGQRERWTDVDDSLTRQYIEKKYRIHNKDKLSDALKIYFYKKSYHPIKQIIEGVEWDGVERIPTLLIKWLKCNDNDYSREVSRLIFAGGINRLYSPGCKFDDVPVLIGTKQGEGKSTFVRWLALRDDFFAEVCDIEGQRGIEALEGAWICEIAELLALTKIKEVEAVKAYITKQSDKYRRPFDKRISEIKRQCIFIGTTNKEQFLTDKTGNRRFYPIKVNSSGYELFEHKEDIQADILQAWAEAKAKYDKGLMLPCADKAFSVIAKERQQDATEEDYRESLIRAYLDDKQITCIMDIWENALREYYRKPNRRESNEIALILQSLEHWERGGTSRQFKKYGYTVQCWKRKEIADGFLMCDTSDNPFN